MKDRKRLSLVLLWMVFFWILQNISFSLKFYTSEIDLLLGGMFLFSMFGTVVFFFYGLQLVNGMKIIEEETPPDTRSLFVMITTSKYFIPILSIVVAVSIIVIYYYYYWNILQFLLHF